MKESTYTHPTDKVDGWPDTAAPDVQPTAYRRVHAIAGEPIRGTRNSAEWSALILAVAGGGIWIAYAAYAIVGTFSSGG